METLTVRCPHCGEDNPPKELLCRRCSRSLPALGDSDPWQRRARLIGLLVAEGMLVLLAFALGVYFAPQVRGPLFGAISSAAPATTAAPTPAATAPVAPPSATRTPFPARPSPTPGPRAQSTSDLQMGQIGRVGAWEIVVNGVSQEQGRMEATVDLSLRNAGDRGATLVIGQPESIEIPGLPGGIPFPLPFAPQQQPAQPSGVDRLILWANGDRNQRAAGAFFGASGVSYSFAAAPGDVMRANMVFTFSRGSQARSLEALFGQAQSLRFDLGQTASERQALQPQPVPSPAANLSTTIKDTWTIRVKQLRREDPKHLTLDLEVTNLTKAGLPILAGPSDRQGDQRDLFAVDGAGRLAWSEADGMPQTQVPAGQTRTVTWRLTIGDPAFAGPIRLTFMADASQDLYAHLDVQYPAPRQATVKG